MKKALLALFASALALSSIPSFANTVGEGHPTKEIAPGQEQYHKNMEKQKKKQHKASAAHASPTELHEVGEKREERPQRGK